MSRRGDPAVNGAESIGGVVGRPPLEGDGRPVRGRALPDQGATEPAGDGVPGMARNIGRISVQDVVEVHILSLAATRSLRGGGSTSRAPLRRLRVAANRLTVQAFPRT